MKYCIKYCNNFFVTKDFNFTNEKFSNEILSFSTYKQAINCIDLIKQKSINYAKEYCDYNNIRGRLNSSNFFRVINSLPEVYRKAIFSSIDITNKFHMYVKPNACEIIDGFVSPCEITLEKLYFHYNKKGNKI